MKTQHRGAKVLDLEVARSARRLYAPCHEKQSLGRQGRVSAEATRSGGSRWARGAAAARRWRGCGGAHAPGQAGPRERGGYAVRVTRYSKPATRFGCSGRLLVSAVRGPPSSAD